MPNAIVGFSIILKACTSQKWLMWAERNWDQIKLTDGTVTRNGSLEFMAHPWNTKALRRRTKKSQSHCQVPQTVSAQRWLCLWRHRPLPGQLQSPGQMSSHGSTQPLSCCRARETCHQLQLFLSTIFINVQTDPRLIVRLCSQPPCSGLSSLLRTGHQEGSSCPDRTNRSKKLFFSKTKRWQ